MSSGARAGQGLLNRHEEIRLALRFFLQSLYKYQQAGVLPDKQQTLFDFARYKGLRPVVDRLGTRPPQVNKQQSAGPGGGQRGGGGGRGGRD